jgi:hypothetical protein
MGTNAELYEQDFFAWSQTTAALIRAGKWDDLDRDALAEEVESLGKRDRRELGSRLQTLVMHLLKWRYQPSERSGSWRGTIRTARREIAAVLADSPSLRRQVPGMLMTGYADARLDASDDTGLPLATFPDTCPWTPEQVLDAECWPEGEPTP